MDTDKRWLVVAGWFYVLGGVAFAIGSLSPAFLDTVLGLAITAYPGGAGVESGLWAGVCGGLTAGMGAIFIAGARAMDQGPAAVARAIAIGVVVWFVVDTGASLAHGSWQNGIGNLGFLALALPPLLRLAARGSTRGPAMGQARPA